MARHRRPTPGPRWPLAAAAVAGIAGLAWCAAVDLRVLVAVSAAGILAIGVIVALQQRRLLAALDERARHSAGEVSALRVALAQARDRAADDLAALRAELTALQAAVPAPAASPVDEAVASVVLHPGPVSAGATEWTEVWPDLADAPTVVDLLAWETRAGLSDDGADSWRRLA